PCGNMECLLAAQSISQESCLHDITSTTHDRDPRQLEQVFWLEEQRGVSWGLGGSLQKLSIATERQSQHWAPSRSRVLVRENEAGQIQINYREHRLPFREVQRASLARS